MQIDYPKSTFNRRLHVIALVFVAIGVTIGFAATSYAWIARGEFAAVTFWSSLSAVAAAIPVYFDYLRLRPASPE